MKIPNCNEAEVPKSKIVDYLLAPDHPEGAPKAKFFHSCGFSLEEWSVLAYALVKQATENECIQVEHGKYGTKYVVEAVIDSPRGETAPVRSVWMISQNTNHPRLITAYPAS